MLGAGEDEGCAGECEGVLSLPGFEEAKWMLSVAGWVVSSKRETVMGIAGLWYFRRGRQMRQNLRGPWCPL